ncbi:MAG: tetratricopeptide repeat protein [Treponema sp.]|jgi:tetratricopeptide (TPR) repeat protein|nr:tetratricopeptide repeat protein [Treponema sp.]
MNSSVERLIQEAYDSLKASDAMSAMEALEEALKIDYEHPEVVYALKCINWWQERMKQLSELSEVYEKGNFILSLWKPFYIFMDRIGPGYEKCVYALRRYVFAVALKFFKEVLTESDDNSDNALLFLQAGRCYKGCGNYELAIKYLEHAARLKKDDGATLSELADVNALLEETRYAKVLFREAFFLAPQAIDLRSLESELIIRLRDKVASLGYSEQEIAEWIPVYGNLYGVFSVKRELKPIELRKLKDSIFALENEVKNRPESLLFSKPRLLNRYFWLIDHYENVKEDPRREAALLIEETMLKIRVIDPAIYEQFRN